MCRTWRDDQNIEINSENNHKIVDIGIWSMSSICTYRFLPLVTHCVAYKKNSVCPSTLWGRDNMAAKLQTLSSSLSWITCIISWIKLHRSFFLKAQMPISQHWRRLWLIRWSPYLNQWWTSLSIKRFIFTKMFRRLNNPSSLMTPTCVAQSRRLILFGTCSSEVSVNVTNIFRDENWFWDNS